MTVVDALLGQNTDGSIGIQIKGIGVRRQDVVAELPKNRPWTRPEKVFPAYCAERGLEAFIVHARCSQNLLCVGRPDYAQLDLPIHRLPFVRCGLVLAWVCD